MNQFAWAYTFMLAMILLEFAIRKYGQKEQVLWREAISNLNSGHLVMLLFRSLEIFAFGLVLTHMSLHWVAQWPKLWQWIFAFIAWDFCFYWMHRLHHKIPLLWAVHHVHHQGEEFNLTLGVRNSWYSSLSNFPFIAILAVLGVPLEIFIIVSSIHYTVQFYNHNAIVKNSWFLDRWLVTPANHYVHHGMHPLYIDKNFGGTFLLWDKLFGSYQAKREDIDNRIGLKSGIPSYNPLLFNHRPLMKLSKKYSAYLPSGKVLDVSDAYIGFAGIVLFVMSIFYVDLRGSASPLIEWSFFSWILMATFFIGGISDKKTWGLIGWIVFCLAFPGYCLFFLQQSSLVLSICFALLFLSAIRGCALLWQGSMQDER